MARRSRALLAFMAALAIASSARPQAPEHGAGAVAPIDCMRCHPELKEAIARAVPHQPALEGNCVRCHAPHAARYEKLLNLRERALCASCHQDSLVEFMKGSVHTPIKDGQCTACHDVHGSANAGLLARAGTELCTSCHEDKHAQTSFTTVHEPFLTGECGDCHKPHNSPYPDQLIAPATKLCQTCHLPASAELLEAHNGIGVEGTGCTSCHEPHASVAPGLLRTVVHSPFGDGSCELCHLLESDTPRLVRMTGARLCAVCHKDYPRKEDSVVHAPVRDGACNACHLPHAGDVKGLLADVPGKLCTSCHQDLVARAASAKSAHPVKDDQGACLACHAPHSSTEPHLLASGEIRTCIACHETAKHGHPLGEDRLDPRTGKPITCVTCHDPHGTQFAYSLRGDQSRGLCLECHDTSHDKSPAKPGGARRD